MSTSQKKDLCSRMTSLLLTVLMLLPAGITPAAAQPNPAPVSALYVNDYIYSGSTRERQERITEIPPVGGSSLWYPDWNNFARQVVRTYDNHGTFKHLREQVEITIYQIGQGSNGGFELLDGKQVSLSSSNYEVLSAYPNEFRCRTTFVIPGDKVDPDAPYTIFSAEHLDITDVTASPARTRHEMNVYIYWDDSDKAAAPNVSFAYDAASGQMVLSGADSTMEYRLKSQTPNDWQPCTDAPMYFDCVTEKETAYYVRYAAVDGGLPSQTQEVILPARRSVPVLTYAATAETISGLTYAMEVKVNNGIYTDVTGASMNLSSLVDGISAGSVLTVSVRYKATATQQCSNDRVFTINPRSQAPTTIEFNPITTTMSGYTTAMQYRGDTDSAWKSLSGTALSLEPYARDDRAAKVYVRFKATSTESASFPMEITIPKLLPGPAGRLDYAEEALVDLENRNYQYSTNGTSWTGLTVSNGQWSIAQLISGSAKTLYLRKAATSTAPISGSTVFELPARLAAPTSPVFVYDDSRYQGKAVLSGLSTAMEYKKTTDEEWTSAPSSGEVVLDLPEASVTYYVRSKPTNQAFASANKSLTLAKPSTAPGCAYNGTTELISSLNTNMEMKIGSGAYVPVDAVTFSVSDLINSLSSGSSLTIHVRYAATATAPASLEEVFTLYPRSAQPATLAYNTAANSLSGCSTAMEFQLDTATGWSSISGATLNLQNYARTDRDVTVRVRMKATTTAAASLPVEFTIPQMVAGPAGSVDYASESVIGLANGDYQYNVDGGTWTNLTVSDGKWDISALLSTSSKTLYLRKSATSTEPMTAATAFAIAARPAAPSAPAFNYEDAAHPGKAVLTGLDSTMQYRKSTDTAWVNVSDSSGIVFDIPDASITYYIRTKSTNQAFASANKSLTLTKPGTAPGCTYSGTTELISSLTTKMEMKIGNGAYAPVEATTFSASNLINSISAGSSLTIHVRYAATATAPASLAKVFTLYPRSAQPTTLVYNTAANSLSGCSTAMEFQLDTATGWSTISGATLNLQNYARTDRDVTVRVRMKATTTAAASLPVEFTIPQMPAGPAGTVDYATESITGLANGAYQYNVNEGTWTNLTISDGKWDISGLISTSARTLYLRKTATSTEPMTAPSTFAIAARSAAPSTPVFNYEDAAHPGKVVLTGLDSTMQYRKSTDTTWTNVSSSDGIVFELPTASVTYYVRTKPTEQAFASVNKTLTLAKPGTAPSCTYSGTTELISSLKTTMEMKIGNGTYTPVEATTFPVSDLINGLTTGSSLTINVRYAATATAPASLAKVFTLYPRSAQPTTLVYNTAANSLSGCSTAMEYQLDTATGWSTISGATLNLQNYARTDRDVTVRVRMKATTTAAASLPVEFTIPQMLPGPTGTVDYANESITGLTNGSFQYSTGGTTWTNLAVSDGTWNISNLIKTSARTLYLRKAATDTAPITAYSTFAIKARAAAPSTLQLVYNDFYHMDKAVVKGLSATMEYKSASDAEWTDISNQNELVFEIPAVSTTYYVRYKATGETFASSNRAVTLAARAAAPACVYNEATETLTKLSTSMEISMNGGLYDAVLSGTTYSLSYLIDELADGETLEVRVRKKATASVPASQDKIFVITARQEPATLAEIPAQLVTPEQILPVPETPVEIPGILEEPIELPDVPGTAPADPIETPELPDIPSETPGFQDDPDSDPEPSDIPDKETEQSGDSVEGLETPDSSSGMPEIPSDPVDTPEILDNPGSKAEVDEDPMTESLPSDETSGEPEPSVESIEDDGYSSGNL